ncbi:MULTISPECIES: HNH endonuclease [Serratia]|uniref:HNH endonuclease n=1 Tax=Serratia TaxID=613 RepID=UPI0018D3FA5C|nr:HNH endonuclease [Serratia marcescens]MBH1918219.1 HNH endonuclease [Serratia marcescens]MBH2679712.1 HNH endonuclease [Serratia marcescens]HCG1441259.1 HNH endonuclease [Pseudomonas aeruginosa]
MKNAYVFDLRFVCGGYSYFSTYTHSCPPWGETLEVREPSIITVNKFITALNDMGKEYCLILDEKSFYNWTCIQGWGIVEVNFAREFIPHWLKKRKCMVTPFGSFTDINLASPSVRKRTFRGKFKKRILDRDNNQCVLCSNTENLTLQHVVPYSRGGETSYRNLVTLCDNCNKRLKSEYIPGLFKRAGLISDFELSLLRGGYTNEGATIRAVQFSSNLMHTRVDLY